MPLRQKIFESNNKGLFDIAVGEGNISADFATELQNSRVALNGEVAKRRGRTYFNTTVIQDAPDVIGLMIYDGNFPGSFEVLAQAGTNLRRYSSSTSSFGTVVKSGLTANEKLNWTMFNNKMILTNGVDNPFKYGYTPKPLNQLQAQRLVVQSLAELIILLLHILQPMESLLLAKNKLRL